MSQPLIMSFRPDAAEMCLDGRKTMTRRVYKETHMSHIQENQTVDAIGDCGYGWDSFDPATLKILWSVGSSIAIKPGRTSKAVGRVMCTGLRVERVQDITEEDARREGMDEVCHDGPIGGRWALGPIGNFYSTWKRLYPSGPKSWDANPMVVVIEFRPLKEGEE